MIQFGGGKGEDNLFEKDKEFDDMFFVFNHTFFFFFFFFFNVYLSLREGDTESETGSRL